MGLCEYAIITSIKILCLLIGAISGLLCVRVLFQKVNERNTLYFILIPSFLTYLVGIIYMTMLSRNNSLDVAVDLRIFRWITNIADLLYKFMRSCYYYIVENTWTALLRPDTNISYIEEGILNVIMFIPFGYLFPALMVQKRKYAVSQIVCIGFLFSLLIETVQLLAKVGYFDLDDLINNTFGTFVGVMLFEKYISPVIHGDEVL